MVMTGRVDLHTHTNASDGTGTPAGNVQLAKAAGLAAIAITDHDTMAGIEEALLEGGRIGITVVPGVELSTVAEGRDIHILGYYTDWRDGLWQERFRTLRDVRGTRNEMIIARLCELGVPVTMEEVTAEAGKDGKKDVTLGRPHIAQVLLSKGYVRSIAEAFDNYLGAGAAAYVNPPRLSPFEAIEWIREAGGTSIIAHPGLYGRDELVEELLRRGANGIEVYHSDHGPEEARRYAAMAQRHGGIVTGGSDYHGERNGILYHGPIGGRTVDISVLALLERGRRAPQ